MRARAVLQARSPEPTFRGVSPRPDDTYGARGEGFPPVATSLGRAGLFDKARLEAFQASILAAAEHDIDGAPRPWDVPPLEELCCCRCC